MKLKFLQFLLTLMLFIFVAGCGNDADATNADGKSNNEGTESENDNAVNDEADNNGEDAANSNSASENDEPSTRAEIETDNESLQDEEETLDEELDLKEIHGTAYQKDDMEYDSDKGYYVLDMLAGLANFTNTQDVENKWVAFAIPDGVSVPDVDDVPSGFVLVTLPDGHTGIALKVPNLKGIKDQTFSLEMPLIGEPDDNDPNENFYLYNVDGNEEHAELIGEIQSTREIDFSVMNDTP